MKPLLQEQGEDTMLEAFLAVFAQDSLLQAAAAEVSSPGKHCWHLKGMCGSYDAIFASIVARLHGGAHVFVLHDAEEAAYFMNDLQNLLPGKEVLLFPTSYKKPYQFLEIENANVLQRAEVLNKINENGKTNGFLIVTYPDALTEKVINQRSLIENTFFAKVGDKLSVPFIAEFLTGYDFEKTDFVYEPGQFSVRGGIVDIFSYANEYPYRIELFGDEIDGIKIFDPLTQLSIQQVGQVSIIPNVQTKLLHEVRESFLRFIPRHTRLWVKDFQQVSETVQQYFQSAVQDFASILKQSGNTKVVSEPSDLFETEESFQMLASQLAIIEFGNRFSIEPKKVFTFQVKSQPSFNKDFNLLAEDLENLERKGFQTFISSESARQLNRISSIFHEIDPNLSVRTLNTSLRAGFIDQLTQVSCYTDHQIFERFHQYYAKKKFSKSKALTLKELRELKVGDFITHIDYGIGRFGGMEIVENNGKKQEAIRLIYRDDDILYISIHGLHKISKYSGQEGKAPAISKLGSPEWEQKKRKVKKHVQDIAKDLIKLYAKRKATKGFAFSKDSYLQTELESSFIYEDTPDQGKATEAVKYDMEQPYPMDRLVCGDVGFGKTEVAIRASFKAVCDSKQVAVLVPTTILAFQHYKTFKERLEKLPCNVAYISRFRSAKEIKATLKEVKEGKVDILIGTHRIIGKDVEFKNLGLLVIDEEQKFGVKAKERLKEMSIFVDVLTLTATPIPRTLQFSLLGARDLSVIATPPPNRQPVTTEIHAYSDELVRDVVRKELRRGGQVFFVHNRIADIESIANRILHLVPDARVCYAHGQMEGDRLEKVMMKFIEGEYDVLVSTNIIESGLDIPNANTIIIQSAHMFGLSDLHQMRGRVGRSNKKAYCYLLTPSLAGLSADARKRLSTLEEFSDLGDGFKVAMRDLDIRGAGNLLGSEQSGFITDLGFDTYNQILEDAIKELKEHEFRGLFYQGQDVPAETFKVDCSFETDFEILIPEDYVTNISERLNLYIAADQLKNEEEIAVFIQSLEDRFGPIPGPVNGLMEMVRLRWHCEVLGFEKVILKGSSMKAYLPTEDQAVYYQSEIFGKILGYVKTHPKQCQLKDAQKRVILTLNNITSVQAALNCLQAMRS